MTSEEYIIKDIVNAQSFSAALYADARLYAARDWVDVTIVMQDAAARESEWARYYLAKLIGDGKPFT